MLNLNDKEQALLKQRHDVVFKLYYAILIVVFSNSWLSYISNLIVRKISRLDVALIGSGILILTFIVLRCVQRYVKNQAIIDYVIFLSALALYLFAFIVALNKIVAVIVWFPFLLLIFVVTQMKRQLFILIVPVVIYLLYIIFYSGIEPIVVYPSTYLQALAGILLVTYASIQIMKLFSDYQQQTIEENKQLYENNLELVALNEEYYATQEELQDNYDKLQKFTYHDPLTGLYNLNGLLRELHTGEGSLVVIRLKGITAVNSLYGVEMGDKIIKLYAETFMAIKKEDSIVARTGNNEFSMWRHEMAPQIDPKDLERGKNHLTEALKKKNLDFHISYNVGFALSSDSEESPLALYERALLALEKADSGDSYNNIILYDQTIKEELKNQDRIISSLSTAIETKAFSLVYQEKTDASTGQVYGLEALARYIHPELGFVSPAVFIPLLEKTNNIVAFGNLILEQAFSDYDLLARKYGQAINVAVNISPSQLLWPEFVPHLKELLNSHHLDPKNITLELTEEVMIHSADAINEILAPLRAIGIKISMDDFGTGYSSLNYISQLVVDELKLDRAFIIQMEKDPRVASLISAILKVQEDFGFHVVAEGVETKEQSDILLAMGCPNQQGYYFSKPLPIDQLKSI